MTTLVAKNRIKYGSRGGPSGPFGLAIEQRGQMVEPGQIFEVDAALAKHLLAEGAAVTRAQAVEEARAFSTRGEEIPTIYREVAAEAHVAQTPAERIDRKSVV